MTGRPSSETDSRALPWLALLMIAVEFAQHVIEVRAGFFVGDMTARKAASTDALRMTFGWAKMLTVWSLAFVVIHYTALGDAHVALRPPAAAFRRYFRVILFQFVPTVAILYAEPLLPLLGLPPTALTPFRAVFGLGQQLLEPLLFLWFVHAALGSDSVGPIASAKATRWLYVWALPLMVVTRTPFNALHAGLNTWGVGQGAAVLWPMLAADALLVGAMVVVIAALQVRIARLVADRRGLSLPVHRQMSVMYTGDRTCRGSEAVDIG